MPKPIEGEQSDGLTCPRCKVRMRVYRTLPQPDDTVERVRRCPKCHQKRVTVEIPKGVKTRTTRAT